MGDGCAGAADGDCGGVGGVDGKGDVGSAPKKPKKAPTQPPLKETYCPLAACCLHICNDNLFITSNIKRTAFSELSLMKVSLFIISSPPRVNPKITKKRKKF